ncbi:acyl-CoA/acyl-ACP dehydrogenase [Streptomyces sp. NBC_00210]|uniref:acyl-CoA dehydrogenase family protein n=1 Tax=Streptomyces sp. NBC_00210 TaxID=2903636 RepID=UPI003244C825
MASLPSTEIQEAVVPSLLTAFATGVLDPGVFQRFPEQDESDRKAGSARIEELERLLTERLDAEEVDRRGVFPEGFLEELRARGFLRLQNEGDVGGLELSVYNTFRLVEQACRTSVPVGQFLSVQAGVGVAALLPTLPPGPLRDHVRRRVAEGVTSAFAVTEPTGRNNVWPGTTASLSADGTHYVLHGQKLFTGGGPVAELVAVSAALGEGARRRFCVCFVAADSEGYAVTASSEFTGSKGLPNGALSLDGVRVPAELVLVGEEGDPRFPAATPLMGPTALLGQLYFNSGPAVALAKNCVEWTRQFVARRAVNGRPLGSYEQIQRLVAQSLSEVYALESVVRWSLIGSKLADRWLERTLIKNISVRTAWRVVDRTVSLLGGEGIETVRSKTLRGAAPLPVERAFRDARGLRVAGNVDFQLDFTGMCQLLSWLYDADRPPAEPLRAAGYPAAWTAALSPANAAHLRAAERHLKRFNETCRELVHTHPDRAELFARQRVVVLLGRLAGELFAVLTVLARSGSAAADGTSTDTAQTLAELYCADADHRIAGLWRRYVAVSQEGRSAPDFAALSGRWLAGAALMELTGP